VQVTRSQKRHKPARTIRVKRRVYKDILADRAALREENKTLGDEARRYSALMRLAVAELRALNGHGDVADVIDRLKNNAPELFSVSEPR
jgi:hypothetical protein